METRYITATVTKKQNINILPRINYPNAQILGNKTDFYGEKIINKHN